MNKPRHVYFVRRADGVGPIKIGCSIQPKERLATLALWSPYKLELVAIAPGGFPDENALHWKFKNARMQGEWFSDVPELLDYVRVVQQTGKLPGLVGDEDRPAAMEAMLADGMKLADVAAYFGVSKARVRQIVFDEIPYYKARAQ